MSNARRIIVFFPAISVLLIVTATVVLQRPFTSPAYACSGGEPNLEWYVNQAEYVALVEVVDVGGAENLSPPATPMPSPAGLPPITPTPLVFDLTGIGATLRVLDDLGGGAPAEFEIDERPREITEEHLRQIEASPWFVAPCPPGFLVPRYEEGERYVVVAGEQPGDPRTATLLKYEVADDEVVLGQSEDGYGWQVAVTRATYDAYFSDLPFESWGSDQDGLEGGRVTAETIPLDQFLTALRGIFSGAVPEAPGPPAASPTVQPVAPSASPRISPPDTGNAGLADGN